VLSPVEALFVLMHALSSDTRVIYIITISFFDSFDYDFELNDFDEEDSYYQRAVELREKLAQVSYTLTDDGFGKLVDIIFRDKLETIMSCGDSDSQTSVIRTQLNQDAICKSIATHYGWSEVDTRRRELVRKYCNGVAEYLRQNRTNSGSLLN